MKQNITIDQLEELSLEQQIKLRDLWKPKQYDLVAYTYEYHEGLETDKVIIKGLYNNDPNLVEEVSDMEGEYVFPKGDCLPLLSIGQMIEYLRQYKLDINDSNYREGEWFIFLNKYRGSNNYFRNTEIIDALWEAVKECLN